MIADKKIGCVPVMDDGRLVGLVTTTESFLWPPSKRTFSPRRQEEIPIRTRELSRAVNAPPENGFEANLAKVESLFRVEHHKEFADERPPLHRLLDVIFH